MCIAHKEIDLRLNNQLNLEGTKAIDQMLKDGIDKQTLERIVAHMSNSVPPEPIPKPKPSLFRFSWLASTYRPPELGSAEVNILNIFAKSYSQSAHGILEELKRYARRTEKCPGYKDVHKRVERLLQLKLIYQTENHFERGAKHYKITPYGLIASLDKDIFYSRLSEKSGYEDLICNTDNFVIRSLLTEFFSEQDTINNFDKLLLATDLMVYLHECCSLATDVCRKFWSTIERYNVTDILPADDIIQKYMAHLDGKPAEEHVLNEIKEYEVRLKERFDDIAGLTLYSSDPHEMADDYIMTVIPNGDKISRPPFPLGEMYVDIVWKLNTAIQEKTKSLIFSFVRKVGERIVKRIAWDDEGVSLHEMDLSRRHSFDYVVADKRFMGLVNSLNEDFDAGRERLNVLKERLTREWL
jgi:hypothetical protein